MFVSMGRPSLQFSSKTVTSTIAKPPEITKSRLGKIARYLEDKPALECVHACQNEVNGYMAFDWAGDRETRRSTTAVLEKLRNHCIESVSCSQTVIALCSDWRRVRCKHSVSWQAEDGRCERVCEVMAQQQSGFRRQAN